LFENIIPASLDMKRSGFFAEPDFKRKYPVVKVCGKGKKYITKQIHSDAKKRR
jgi:hypothetical protein